MSCVTMRPSLPPLLHLGDERQDHLAAARRIEARGWFVDEDEGGSFISARADGDAASAATELGGDGVGPPFEAEFGECRSAPHRLSCRSRG
jgi:hypothetical protein